MSEVKKTVRDAYRNAATVVDAMEARLYGAGDRECVEICAHEWNHILVAFATMQAIIDSLAEKKEEDK